MDSWCSFTVKQYLYCGLWHMFVPAALGRLRQMTHGSLGMMIYYCNLNTIKTGAGGLLQV